MKKKIMKTLLTANYIIAETGIGCDYAIAEKVSPLFPSPSGEGYRGEHILHGIAPLQASAAQESSL